MIAIGFFLFIQTKIPQLKNRHLLLVILVGGLFASISRGPWVGAVALLIVFVALGQNALSGLIKLISAGVLAFALAAILPGGEKLINLLPYIGKVDVANVQYRAQLLETGMNVAKQNPLMGTVNFRDLPEMQTMKQGQGIVDMVNTYLSISSSF